MSGISVTGGAGSIAARCDDMMAVASLMTHNADEIEHLIASARHLAQYEAGWGVDLDVLTHTEVVQALEDVVVETSRGLAAASKLRTCAARLMAAVGWYRMVEADQSDGFWDSLIDLPVALAKGTVTLALTADAMKAATTLVTSDPALFADFGNALRPINALLAPEYADGHPTVTALEDDTTLDAITQPRGLRDLLAQLSLRDHGAAGEISVGFTYGGTGSRHVIVDIPGTKSWDPLPTSDVTSVSTNSRAVEGLKTSYEEGVLAAMKKAGVAPTDEVMLVGHSEGGMVAVTAAREAIKSKRFNVTHVVTAGSPISTDLKSLPKSVQVLALENHSDIIPEVDGSTNPERSNITTVTGDVNHGTVGGNHSLPDSYEHIAEQADHSHNASIREFLASADGFLNGCGQNVHRFVIHRKY